MSFLKKLFTVDPQKEIAKAERWLDDTPERAFEHLQGVLKKVPEAHRGMVNQALMRARTAVIERALQHALESESDGFFEDAADWLESAIAHTRDEAQRQEWKVRQDELMMRQFSIRQQERLRAEAEVTPTTESTPEIDREALFDAAVDVYLDEVAGRYRAQGKAFRQLFLQLQDGEQDGVEEGFSQILANANEDSDTHAVVALERGKLRLLQENFKGAKADFEACWQAWGDDLLDWPESHSLPSLWAEAALGTGDSDAVLDRLHDLADPSLRRIDAILPYSKALASSEATDDALTYLRHVVRIFPEYEELAHFYAVALQNSGKPQEAIACLEAVIAPSWMTTHSRTSPMPLPSLSLLLALYLYDRHPAAQDRVTELADLLQRHSQGQLGDEDHQLLSKAQDLYGYDLDAERHLQWTGQTDAMGVELGVAEAGADIGWDGATEGIG